MDEIDVFSALEKAFQKQIHKAYIAGAHEGAISTASTLYTVLVNMGLEKDNIVFDILKDIAQRHGCNDLDAYSMKVKEEMLETKDKYPS